MKLIDHNSPEIPQACSGCYRQNLDDDHVDLGVVHDGGVFRVKGEDEREVHPVDDLILCRTCLVGAGRLVGLGEVDEVKAELAQALAERTAAVEQAAQALAFADQLRAALALQPAEQPQPRRAKAKTEPSS